MGCLRVWMMKIEYVKGNLLATPHQYILHGCNAQGVMGSGVAKAIRDKYPSAFSVYRYQYERGLMALGAVTYAEQDDGKTIINAVTQEFYGRGSSKVYVSYTAINEALARISWWLSCRQYSESLPYVAMPKIGAGLGGGDWEIISEIIEQKAVHFQPVVYCW